MLQTLFIWYLLKDYASMNKIYNFLDVCAMQYKHYKNFPNLYHDRDGFCIDAERTFFVTPYEKSLTQC